MSDGGRLYIDFEAAAAAGAIVLGGDRATHSEWVRPLDHLSPPTPPGQAMVAHPAYARAHKRAGGGGPGGPGAHALAQHAGGGRMCQFFLEGRCIYGHGCRYSHGIPPGALGVAPAHAQHHVISSVPLGGHPQLAHIPAYFAYSPPITPPPASVSPPAPTHYEWPFITIDPSERHLLVHALQGDVSIASLIAVARAKFQKAAVPADQGAPPHAVLVGALFGWCASVSKRIRLDLDGASAAGWLVRGGMRPFEWVAVPLSPGIAAMHAHHHHHLPPQYYAQAGGLAHASVMAMPPGPPAGHAPLVASVEVPASGAHAAAAAQATIVGVAQPQPLLPMPPVMGMHASTPAPPMSAAPLPAAAPHGADPGTPPMPPALAMTPPTPQQLELEPGAPAAPVAAAADQ